MSKTGYAKQQDVALGVQSPRQAEGYALVEVARRMEDVRRDDQSTRQAKIDIFTLNWRLWTIFQSELSNPDNPLPTEIKKNMLQLANFIDKHTIKEMRDPTDKGLEVLVNINRQVAAGLLGDAGTGLDDTQSGRLEQIQAGDGKDAGQVQAKSKPATQSPDQQAPVPEPSRSDEVFGSLGQKTAKSRFKSKKVD